MDQSPIQIAAVGDIHGRLDLLEQCLERVLPLLPPRAELVFLGDYVDRGPDSRGVVCRLMGLRRTRPGVVCLRGNHESMLLDALAGRGLPMWLFNGGASTLASYGLRRDEMHNFPADHAAFLAWLPLWHQSGDYLFVHASVTADAPLEGQNEFDLLWSRRLPTEEQAQRLGKTIVFGHTPMPRPLLGERVIGIDTGAVYGGSLSCLLLPQRKIISFS